MNVDVVVVGAGLAGLACAQELVARGRTVAIVDKGRSPGGRATSRREPGERSFDHGAQFFTARGAWLEERLPGWERAGVVARWSPRVRRLGETATTTPGEPWWVGTPRMGALAAHLATGLDLTLGHAVSRVAHEGGRWRVTVEADVPTSLVSSALVVTVPPAQCAALLAAEPRIVAAASGAQLEPCWALMLSLDRDLVSDADVVLDPDGPVGWAAREGSKPARRVASGEAWWTLHASTVWSREHLEATPDEVAHLLPRELAARWAIALPRVLGRKAHRWRYARVVQVAGDPGLVDEDRGLVVAGDWTRGARVEAALESGVAAAWKVLER